jgi:hypothetical protein
LFFFSFNPKFQNQDLEQEASLEAGYTEKYLASG